MFPFLLKKSMLEKVNFLIPTQEGIIWEWAPSVGRHVHQGGKKAATQPSSRTSSPKLTNGLCHISPVERMNEQQQTEVRGTALTELSPHGGKEKQRCLLPHPQQQKTFPSWNGNSRDFLKLYTFCSNIVRETRSKTFWAVRNSTDCFGNCVSFIAKPAKTYTCQIYFPKAN